MEVAEEGAPQARHVKKRALKNKSVAVSFDEKALSDFVSGFHKRKKKRRKVAELQIQEKDRRKRIELRKKRKMDRDYVQFGGPPPTTDDVPDEGHENDEQDEESDPIASISGTTTYDNGDVKVTVTTCEISCEEEQKTQAAAPGYSEGAEKKQNMTVIKKKPVTRVAKHKSKTKLKKRDKRKAGRQDKRKK